MPPVDAGLIAKRVATPLDLACQSWMDTESRRPFQQVLIESNQLISAHRDVRRGGCGLWRFRLAVVLSLVDTANLLQTGTVVHSGPVAELDDSTLATHLGIGRVLATATGSALSARKGA